MNPDQIRALIAQLLGQQAPTGSFPPSTQPTMPTVPGIGPAPSSAAPPSDFSSYGPPPPPTGHGGSGGVVHGGGSGGVGPDHQGNDSGYQATGGSVQRPHPLRAIHAQLVHLLLHGTKPITGHQHDVLRALRQNTVLPNKRRQMRNPTYGPAGGGVIQGGGPSRNRGSRSFGPG